MSAEEVKPRGRGRPPKYAGEGKRQNFSFRIRDKTRDLLIEAVAKTGRSLSEEIEHRIEDSFKWEQAFGTFESMRAQAESIRADAEIEADQLKDRSLMAELKARDWEQFEVGPDRLKFWAEQGTKQVMGQQKLHLGSGEADAISKVVVSAIRETLKPDLLQPEKGESDEGEHNPPRA